MFCWFVLALTAAFVVAARSRGSRSTATLVAGPAAHGGFLLLVLLTAEDVVLFGFTA